VDLMSPPVAWIPMDTESLKSGFSEISNRSRRTGVSLSVNGGGGGNNSGNGSVVSLSLPSRHHHRNHHRSHTHRYVTCNFISSQVFHTYFILYTYIKATHSSSESSSHPVSHCHLYQFSILNTKPPPTM